MFKKSKHSRGFSLIEMMVVISIIAILVVASLGSLQSLMKNTAETRMTSLQKLIDYGVIMARSERRGVIVCAITADSLEVQADGSITPPECSNSSNWGDSAIVAFLADDSSATIALSANDIISSLRGGDGGSIKLNVQNSARLSIKSDGFFATGAGNIVYCRNNEFQSVLIVNLVGRVRYSSDQGIYSC